VRAAYDFKVDRDRNAPAIGVFRERPLALFRLRKPHPILLASLSFNLSVEYSACMLPGRDGAGPGDVPKYPRSANNRRDAQTADDAARGEAEMNFDLTDDQPKLQSTVSDFAPVAEALDRDGIFPTELRTFNRGPGASPG
jgi:hypothetical protein